MNVYLDHASTQSDLLEVLNFLIPSHDVKFYRLILKSWNNVTIVLLKQAHNIHTISQALIYNHARTGKRLPKAIRPQLDIPEPYEPTLV